MKCPKCNYLAFETGDRCKHCGFDFSLAATAAYPSQDTFRVPPIDAALEAAPLDRHDLIAREPEGHALPLFLSDAGDDTPLITVPAKPRPPLAVRRTPDAPRTRATPRAAAPEPVLDFREAAPAAGDAAPTVASSLSVDSVRGTDRIAGRRAAAAALDLALLAAISAAVLHFTLRLTDLTWSDLALVPIVPFGLFTALLAVAYTTAFTAIGGQTLGKMAVGIQVVGEGARTVDGATAFRRTLASAADVVTLGLAYVPALVGPDRRAVHDRVAGTRVVARRSA